MARLPKKSVYERIADTEQAIKTKEEELVNLKKILKDLYMERDSLEMQQLFERMREQNLTLEEAMSRLANNNN